VTAREQYPDTHRDNARVALPERRVLAQVNRTSCRRKPGRPRRRCGQRTHRIDLPITGWYRIRVSPSQDGGDPRERGAYRFALVPFDANPETAARQVTLGDSVSSERIDYDDDMDEFVLTGTPGAEFAMCAQGGLRLVAYDTTMQDSRGPMTGALLVGQVLSLIGSTSQYFSPGPFVVPPAGTVRDPGARRRTRDRAL